VHDRAGDGLRVQELHVNDDFNPFGTGRTFRWGAVNHARGSAGTLKSLGSCAGKISHRDSLNTVHEAIDVNSLSRQLRNRRRPELQEPFRKPDVRSPERTRGHQHKRLYHTYSPENENPTRIISVRRVVARGFDRSPMCS
jgi:hypothetical protein